MAHPKQSMTDLQCALLRASGELLLAINKRSAMPSERNQHQARLAQHRYEQAWLALRKMEPQAVQS